MIMKNKSMWFNDGSREAKKEFYQAKKQNNRTRTQESLLHVLKCRKRFIKVKNISRSQLYTAEKANIVNLSEASPRRVWKYIQKFKSSDRLDSGVGLDEFKKTFSNYI